MAKRMDGKAPHSGDAFAGMPDKASPTRGPVPSGSVKGRKDEGTAACNKTNVTKEMDDGRRSPTRSPKAAGASAPAGTSEFKSAVEANYSCIARARQDGKTDM